MIYKFITDGLWLCIPYNQSSFYAIIYFRNQMIEVSLLHNNMSMLQYIYTKCLATTKL